MPFSEDTAQKNTEIMFFDGAMKNYVLSQSQQLSKLELIHLAACRSYCCIFLCALMLSIFSGLPLMRAHVLVHLPLCIEVILYSQHFQRHCCHRYRC